MTTLSRASLDAPAFSPVFQQQSMSLADELRQAKGEVELLKTMDPFRAAEMALEVQMERMRLTEAMKARDATIQRLADAYTSIRQKNATIEQLQREKDELARNFLTTPGQRDGGRERLEVEIKRLEEVVQGLREEIKTLRNSSSDLPPTYEEGTPLVSKNGSPLMTRGQVIGGQAPNSSIPPNVLRDTSLNVSRPETVSIKNENNEVTKVVVQNMIHALITGQMEWWLKYAPFQVANPGPETEDPEFSVNARHAILASLPIPSGIPEDALQPIVIPPPYTLHDFFGNASASVRNSLYNYRVFQQYTTAWCPEREEHGYLLTPVFRCSTNLRVTTAHRWAAVDVVGRLNKPTECFYVKDGKWYYAGVYEGFSMNDLTINEWEALSTETTQAIIKDTLSGRKNTSPQNVYETAQLYAAGALKVACVGLKCVGFNNALYRAVLDQAGRCVVGKWKHGEGAEKMGKDDGGESVG